MNVKAITRNVGTALLVNALFMFFAICVSVAKGNDSAFTALVISFLITFTVGIFPYIFVRKTPAITMKEGYLIIFLSWLLSFIFGMLPYVLWGGPFTVENAWFESVSGFTTTGSTILENIEALPDSLLFWRSATHFIGGLGVVVFLLLIIPTASPVRLRLTNMELSSLSREGYNTRANRTVYIFAYVYVGLALVSFLCYWAAGMKPIDAVCHAFSVSATGGFSTKNLSIAAFDSRLIEGLTMLFMLLSSLHFGSVYMAVVTRSFRPFNNSVVKLYLGSLVVFTLLLALIMRPIGIWDSAFHVICIASTTGFATIDNTSWPLAGNLVLLGLGIMCGCAGSTSGGLKVDRVLIFLKAVKLQISRILHPSEVHEMRFGSSVLAERDIIPHLLYSALYFFILLVSFALAVGMGLNGENAFFASLSSLGNVGPAINELGSVGNFNGLPSVAKFLFTIDMFLGRIEIFPVLAVFGMMFNTGRRR